jgi:hypothetical protein
MQNGMTCTQASKSIGVERKRTAGAIKNRHWTTGCWRLTSWALCV